MALRGAILRFGQMGLRLLEFTSAAIILGIYSYFLAVLSQNNIPIPIWEKAVEGMSGAAVLYTLLGVLFTLFLGGVTFFALVAIILDVCFVGCFAAIEYYTRHGANSCKDVVISSESAPWGWRLGLRLQPEHRLLCGGRTQCLSIPHHSHRASVTRS